MSFYAHFSRLVWRAAHVQWLSAGYDLSVVSSRT
ncbi:hypothetical protein V1293_005114 [Bradyrhizobium sp. AZCC 1693]